jgi:hypothetical protein
LAVISSQDCQVWNSSLSSCYTRPNLFLKSSLVHTYIFLRCSPFFYPAFCEAPI